MRNYRKMFALAMALPVMSFAACQDSHGGFKASEGVKGAIKALNESHDVKLYFQTMSEAGQIGLYYTTTYRSNYVYSSRAGAEWGYVSSSSGVYSVGADDEYRIVGGELLKDEKGAVYSSVWGHDLFSWFDKYDFSSFEEGNEITVKKKANVMATLDFFGLERTRYFDVKSLTMKVGKELSSFQATLKVGMQVFVLGIDSFGSDDQDMLGFLNNGGKHFTPNDDLSEMVRLFRNDNYNRQVLDYEDVDLDCGLEHFTPNYFYGDYNANGIAKGMAPRGIMRIANKSITDSSSVAHELNGCYYFSIQSNRVNPSLAEPYNPSTDITSVCFYLHNPLLFSSLQYLSYDQKNDKYSIEREKVLHDFAVNNQVADLIKAAGYKPLKLEMKIEKIFTFGGMVTFDLYYGTHLEGANFLRYRFLDFEKANISVVDDFMKHYSLA